MSSNGKFRIAITPEFGDRTDELIGPALREVFDPHPDIEYELMAADPDKTGVPSVIDAYDAIIVFSYFFPAKSFEGVKRLACLSRWGVGYDQIDTAASTNADVVVAIAPLAVRRPVAEGIITLVLALAKNLKHLDKRTSEGRWRDDIEARGICIEGRTMGSVGVGSIAGEMFRMAKGIGFGRLLGYDPYVSKERAEELGVELVDLDTLMSESDFVAVNTFLSDDTRGLVGAKQFELMKPTAYIINTARGPIIDEKALTEALQQGKIAGAGLDVFEEEPTPLDNPLLHMENVIIAPHSIAWTKECIRDNSLHSCRHALAVYMGEAPAFMANAEVTERPGFQAKLAARRS
jgi:phosphoglycerate dehydrogenase-like enzyme